MVAPAELDAATRRRQVMTWTQDDVRMWCSGFKTLSMALDPAVLCLSGKDLLTMPKTGLEDCITDAMTKGVMKTFMSTVSALRVECGLRCLF